MYALTLENVVIGMDQLLQGYGAGVPVMVDLGGGRVAPLYGFELEVWPVADVVRDVEDKGAELQECAKQKGGGRAVLVVLRAGPAVQWSAFSEWPGEEFDTIYRTQFGHDLPAADGGHGLKLFDERGGS